MTDACRHPVSGIDNGLIGKGIEFFPDAAHQDVRVASRQVRATDTFTKKYISGNHETLFFCMEGQAGRRMSGRKQQAKFILIQEQRDFGIKIMNGTGVVVKRQIPHESAGGCIVQDRPLTRMNMEFQPIGFVNKPVAKNMVQMTMGIDQHPRLKAIGGDEAGQLLSLAVVIASGVNNDAVLVFIVKDIGILLQGIERENFNV